MRFIFTRQTRAQNALALAGVPAALFAASGITLLSLEGNPVAPKELQGLPGYAAYEARFAATYKKREAAQRL